MEIKLYIILLTYFAIGGVLLYFITNKKDDRFVRNNWLKYFIYLIIVNTLFLSIMFLPDSFLWISIVIALSGLSELIMNTIKSKKYIPGISSVIIFLGISFLFIKFSMLPANHLFYILFLTTSFDAFSQLSGQLFGKRKLIYSISPNKTVEGTVGGILLAAITSVLIKDLLNINVISSVILGFGIAISSLLGDLSASFIKRKFGVKDFSKLVPGHGGVLDRFDSLIMSSVFYYLIIMNF